MKELTVKVMPNTHTGLREGKCATFQINVSNKWAVGLIKKCKGYPGCGSSFEPELRIYPGMTE